MAISPKSAVLFLVFNRPDCTAKTFAAIRAARPPRLLVVADGARPNRPDDIEKCREVRRLIDEGVDWPCSVQRNYAEKNLGCAERVASGLDWGFSLEDRLIILEDDCLPDQSLFPYFDELLERYRDDQRIGQICATPFIQNTLSRKTSYIFSRYGPIWGWASWSRAWKYYNLKLESWPEIEESGNLSSVVPDALERRGRKALYRALHQGPRSTWDYQWGYAKMTNSLLSVIPNCSLIENLGFGPDATHTTAGSGPKLTRGQMPQQLVHPVRVLADARFDREFSVAFQARTWKKWIVRAGHRLNDWIAHDP